MDFNIAKMKKSIEKITRNIMLQGTSSHVGKSVLTAALCRALRDRGFKVAPFKAQNMALNSAVALDGGEIGRAQAFQAEAAGITPSVHMNPILLKPTGDSTSQVIVQGKIRGVMSAREYHSFKKEALAFVLDSYGRLASNHDVIVIEGAGSPAEVNLREGDIANMGIATAVESPVLLVGDIDRGGVFASLVGTIELLAPLERALVKGLIINKFRGDKALLAPGLEFIRNKTGKPVLGTIPYLDSIVLPDEDSVSLHERKSGKNGACVKVKVIRLPRISNFTDFDPFRTEEKVELSFIQEPDALEGAHAVIIPGTKDTIGDLRWLKERGFDRALKAHVGRGRILIGICGGFQMLGKSIGDPHGVESGGHAEALGFLDARTVLKEEKSTFQARAKVSFAGKSYAVSGYEIHMGETAVNGPEFSTVTERNGSTVSLKDGGVSDNGRVWGTYMHGIFDNDALRAGILGLLDNTEPRGGDRSFRQKMDESLSSLAMAFEENVDMKGVMKIAGL